MRVSHCEKRPQLLPLRHSQQHATYLRRLHAVPPSTVWVVPFPAAGESPFRDDHGSAEPRVADALAAFGSGQGSEHAALTALASSRLLVPIVAVAARRGSAAQSPGHTPPGGRGARAPRVRARSRGDPATRGSTVSRRAPATRGPTAVTPAPRCRCPPWSGGTAGGRSQRSPAARRWPCGGSTD